MSPVLTRDVFNYRKVIDKPARENEAKGLDEENQPELDITTVLGMLSISNE